MLPFPLNEQIPPTLQGVIYDFWWDLEKLQKLQLPTEIVVVSDLLWHLDLPWWEHNGKAFSISPRGVWSNPEQYAQHYRRTMEADLKHPLIVRKDNNRLVIVDGIHRLLKAAIQGKKKIAIRLFNDRQIPLILFESAYPPPTTFFRTPEQKADQFLSWARADDAFFGGGACHILAYTFFDMHRNEGYDIIYTRPLGKHPGNHVYIYKNGWAFDFAGWTKEDEVLAVMRRSYTELYPEWDFERMIITKMELEDFCKQYHHRPPAYYAYLPWERTYRYLKQFKQQPPADS
jgi:hypothetical protein